jgi:hypothetical protein
MAGGPCGRRLTASRSAASSLSLPQDDHCGFGSAGVVAWWIVPAALVVLLTRSVARHRDD